jgi:hypothetical protein
MARNNARILQARAVQSAACEVTPTVLASLVPRSDWRATGREHLGGHHEGMRAAEEARASHNREAPQGPHQHMPTPFDLALMFMSMFAKQGYIIMLYKYGCNEGGGP